MNVMQHHMVGDCSRKHLMICLINELSGWAHHKREVFYDDWKKTHSKKNTDWLKNEVRRVCAAQIVE